MRLQLSNRQKKLLARLLDKYENSRSYQGTNKRNQNFSVRPGEIWKGYDDNFTEIAEIEDFERELIRLEEAGLVKLTRKNGEIGRITAVPDQFDVCYELLDREEKTEVENRELQMYLTYESGAGTAGHKVLRSFCRDQISQLTAGKKARYQPERAEKICRLLDRILENHKDILERELSVQILKDSKLFEKSYRNPVCSILEEYGDLSLPPSDLQSPRERQQRILETFHVLSNPSYVYLKGEVELSFQDGTRISLKGMEPIALSAEKIRGLEKVSLKGNRIRTVENLTAFHRMESDALIIYTGGYHSLALQQFLQKVLQEKEEELSKKEEKSRRNDGVIWEHAGDIDPDGFLILENLKAQLHHEILPLRMSAAYLKKYRQYGKKLTEGDRAKLYALLDRGLHTEVLTCMKQENIKLEQEIIIEDGA